MFAPKVAKVQTKAAESPTNKLAPQRSTLAARPFGGEPERADMPTRVAAPSISWDFSKISIFPPEGTSKRQSNRDPTVRSTLAESGRPLDPTSLAYFQSGLGYDLSSVQLHTSESAAASAASLSARAYAVGRHIVLGGGEYSPGTTAGRRILAHELAHVIQQSRGGSVPSRTEQRGLEASADRAADHAARGERVSVDGSSGVAIARKSMFEEFSTGKYDWAFLIGALTYGRPVRTIINDINGLTTAEINQAIKDLTQERTKQARKVADLIAKQAAQTDPKQRDLFDPMIEKASETLSREEQVLEGVSATIAIAETPASLKSGTVAPTAAEKPLVESALKPDLRTTSSGTVAPFEENITGDPKSYLDKLREATPILIDGHYKQQVDNRGKAEHSDPTKVHALSELERVGNASKRETDAVFGQYKKGPALKADTKTARGNIHDLWQDTENRLKGMGPGQKREMASQLVFYFFQSDAEIGAINAKHNADPKFTGGGSPTNQEGKDQKKVVDESTAKPADVKRLNEIDRGWDASAQAGQVNIQVFKKPDEAAGALAGPGTADRDFMWDMFQTLIHEYLHTLAHPAYNHYASSFGDTSNQNNTLIEGVDSLLDEIVWSAVEPHVTDQKLRDDVEGPAYSKLPPMDIAPASRRRYDSYTQAVKLVNVVGIRNLYAAYFLGDVKKIKG